MIQWGAENLPSAEIRLLGSPHFRIDGEGQQLPEKAYVLLAILASTEGRRATRSHIRTILWADSDREKANASLRQLIARIHRVELTSGVVLLSMEGEALGLTPTCRVDYDDFLVALDATASGENAGAAIRQRCDALAALWHGVLLEGLAFGEAALDEWLEARREQMRRRFLEAGRRVLDAPSLPEYADAQWRLAEKILDIDRTEEVAYRSMIRVCLARGDRGYALRVFNRCKRILRDELAVEPDSLTLALGAQLRDLAIPIAPSAPKAEPGPKEAAGSGTAAFGRPRPVVMVLPPMGTDLDPACVALAVGLAEDITVGLTKFRRFSIVASPTPGMLSFKDRCAESGLSVFDVDYTVSLSLMPTPHGYRLTVRLTDAGSSEVLWGTNPEFTIATVGDTFDRLIRLTVRTLIDVIDSRQVRIAMSSEQAPAYALCAQARLLLHKADLQAIRRAKKLFKLALARATDFAPAIIGIARAASEEWLVRGLVEHDLLKEAVTLADRAAELDPLDGRALRERGRAHLYMRRYDESLKAFDAAIALNPDDADILSDYADALAHFGEPQRGLPYSRKALELNVMQPDDYVWTLGSIHFQLGEYQAALDALRPMDGNPATARLLSACAARAGDKDLARRYSQLVRETYPRFEVASVRDIVPNRNRVDAEHLIDGLRLAGLA